MEVVILSCEHDVAQVAADVVQETVEAFVSPVLGVATGSSPLRTYAELRRRHRESGLSFADVTAFLLDEYVGLDDDHPQRYRNVVLGQLCEGLDLPASAVYGPDGNAADIPVECARYEAAIEAAGGIDVQLLGIGSDGHLGFNEPGSSLASRTRIKTLTARTRADNARFFAGPHEVPRHVLTQGVGTILEARHLVLIATGAGKAQAVAAAVEGPVSASCPASAMQVHPHATVLLDEDAAARLVRADHYREVYAAKPAWQGL